NGRTKYNFIVHPGAKLADVKLHIQGANSIALNNGSLDIATNLSTLKETVPNSYFTIDDSKTEVHAGFIQNSDGSYGLNVAEPIPANATLTVDPMPNISWGTYYVVGNEDAR